MSKEDSESEEEILVYAEFEDNVNVDKHRTIHVLGIDDKNPIIQLDDTFFMGKYEHSLGTYMFFESDPAPPSKDPLFDKYPDKCLKYVCKTRKLLNMEHAYVTPKEGKDTNLQSQSRQTDDVKQVTFENVEQAAEAFREFFTPKPTPMDTSITKHE